jgi:hypothetical protein
VEVSKPARAFPAKLSQATRISRGPARTTHFSDSRLSTPLTNCLQHAHTGQLLHCNARYDDFTMTFRSGLGDPTPSGSVPRQKAIHGVDSDHGARTFDGGIQEENGVRL